MTVSGITDNRGNSFVLSRLMTTKFPLVVILAELAMQLRQQSMDLSLDWAPRDQNEEADALTNADFGAFSEDRRMRVEVAEVKWIVLDKLMDVARDLYAEVRRRREQRGPRAGGPGHGRPEGRPKKKLREVHPW